MNRFLLAVLVVSVLSWQSVWAAGGPDRGAAPEAREAAEDAVPHAAEEPRKDRAMGKPEKEGAAPKGLEKQQEKKAGQERKELGKGSEQGQEMREQHSRKWWKFWGND